jgi:malate dehydrogenase (oxaloacetate-decarboxylating)(NADP+)
MAMEKLEGIPRDVALKKIWLRDSKGLIVKDRPAGGISHHKADFAHEHRCRHKFLYGKDDICKHHT